MGGALGSVALGWWRFRISAPGTLRVECTRWGNTPATEPLREGGIPPFSTLLGALLGEEETPSLDKGIVLALGEEASAPVLAVLGGRMVESFMLELVSTVPSFEGWALFGIAAG